MPVDLFELTLKRVAIVATLLVCTTHAGAQTPIRISAQPGVWYMLPLKVAVANDYWKDAGLEPTFLSYPAGVPQMKANAEWDVGMTGATPALLGAKEFNIVTVGIAADISRTNVLMASKAFVDKINSAKTIPKGTRFALTLNSTVDYAAQTCLALWGGNNKSEMVIKGGSQPEVIKAGADGEADVVGLWTPHIYAMQEKHGFVRFCSGKDFSPGIFGAIVAKRDYATANPQVVAKFLAVISRAVNWMTANPEKSQAMHISTAATDKITVSTSAAKNDYAEHAMFNLRQQLEAMSSRDGGINDSQAGRSFFSINVFLNEGKQGSRTLKPASFMDASYLKLASDDPVLAKIANNK